MLHHTSVDTQPNSAAKFVLLPALLPQGSLEVAEVSQVSFGTSRALKLTWWTPVSLAEDICGHQNAQAGGKWWSSRYDTLWVWLIMKSIITGKTGVLTRRSRRNSACSSGGTFSGVAQPPPFFLHLVVTAPPFLSTFMYPKSWRRSCGRAENDWTSLWSCSGMHAQTQQALVHSSELSASAWLLLLHGRLWLCAFLLHGILPAIECRAFGQASRSFWPGDCSAHQQAGRQKDILTFHFTRLRFRQGTAIVIFELSSPREGPLDRSSWRMNKRNQKSTVETFSVVPYSPHRDRNSKGNLFNIIIFKKFSNGGQGQGFGVSRTGVCWWRKERSACGGDKKVVY